MANLHPRTVAHFAETAMLNGPLIERLRRAGCPIEDQMFTWSYDKLEYYLYRETVVGELATMDRAMLKSRETAEFLREEWMNVLITGPTGTGKETLAKILHGYHKRGPFLSENFAGITDTLFESKLFGHRKGSFTGAAGDKPGILEAAGDGTVFLDEIGDMKMEQQAKLLRAIGERQVTPVGSNDIIPIKCRFVCATNKDLRAMYRADPPTFRIDLFFRLAQVVISTTPLIDRADDVPLIAARICRRRGWTAVPTEAELEHAAYAEGNGRELENWLINWRYRLLEDGTEPAPTNIPNPPETPVVDMMDVFNL
ncbi:hypothetical protein CCP2SC5_740015 [Azospirillaceae bacterium]